MSTVTSTAVAKRQPRAIHAGLNSVYVELSASTTLTVGSVLQMLLLPDRARVVDGWVTQPVATNVIDVGDVLDPNRYVASASPAANIIQRFFNQAGAVASGAGFQLSISQTDVVKHKVVSITIGSAGGDTSGKYRLKMDYYMDGEETAT